MSWIIVLVVIAATVFWAVGAYNRLVSLRNKLSLIHISEPTRPY